MADGARQRDRARKAQRRRRAAGELAVPAALTCGLHGTKLSRSGAQHGSRRHRPVSRRRRRMPLHRGTRDQHHRHQPGQHERDTRQNEEQVRRTVRRRRRRRVDRRIADIGRAGRHERQDPDGTGTSEYCASRPCSAAPPCLSSARGSDLQSRQRDFPAGRTLPEHAHHVLVLEEPPRRVRMSRKRSPPDDVERNRWSADGASPVSSTTTFAVRCRARRRSTSA